VIRMAAWTHSDPALLPRVASGLERAIAGDWQSGPLPVRTAELRAIVVATARCMGHLVGTVAAGAELVIDPWNPDAPSGDRRRAAVALYAPFDALMVGDAREPLVAFKTETPADTGALPVLAVVAIAISSAVAIGYVAHQAAAVIDRQLARNAVARAMLAEHAQAVALTDKHIAREKAAGKPLPLDAATKSALDASAKRAADYAASTTTILPLPRGVPSPGIFESAAAGFGVGTIVVGGLVLWMLIK